MTKQEIFKYFKLDHIVHRYFFYQIFNYFDIYKLINGLHKVNGTVESIYGIHLYVSEEIFTLS